MNAFGLSFLFCVCDRNYILFFSSSHRMRIAFDSSILFWPPVVAIAIGSSLLFWLMWLGLHLFPVCFYENYLRDCNWFFLLFWPIIHVVGVTFGYSLWSWLQRLLLVLLCSYQDCLRNCICFSIRSRKLHLLLLSSYENCPQDCIWFFSLAHRSAYKTTFGSFLFLWDLVVLCRTWHVALLSSYKLQLFFVAYEIWFFSVRKLVPLFGVIFS